MKKHKFKYKGLKFEIFDQHTKHSINQTISQRFLKGAYENQEIEAIQKYIKPDDIVLELGASLGVTSCFIGKSLSNDNNLVCIEANPTLIENIKHNANINNCNFHLKEAAVSYNNREVNFNFNGLSHSGSIFKKTHLIGENKEKKYGKYSQIKRTTLTPMDIEKEYNMKFNTFICDIEGEEYDLLYNLYDYFKDYDKMIIEFHPHFSKSNYNFDSLKRIYSEKFNVSYNDRIGVFIKK